MFANLAGVEDLDERGIAVPDGVDPDVILGAASAAIRDAAGCPISQETSTVTLVVDDYSGFTLPAGPVASVDSITVAGVAVPGWRKVGNDIVIAPSLTRWTDCLPVEVTVTYTHGYPVIPADIVDLACGMASVAMNDGNYGRDARLAYVRLGDYGEGYRQASPTDSPSPLALPDRVRQALRERFGTSVALIRT